MIFDEAIRSVIRNDNSELTQIIDDVEDYLLVDTKHFGSTKYKDAQAFIAETVVEYEDEINRVAYQINESISHSIKLAWSIIKDKENE